MGNGGRRSGPRERQGGRRAHLAGAVAALLGVSVCVLSGCSAVGDARVDLVVNSYINVGDEALKELPIDRAAALEAYDRALEARPSDPGLAQRLAGRYAGLEAWDRAWSCLRGRGSADPHTALLAGQILVRRGKREEGIKLLYVALAASSADPRSRAMMENNVGYVMADANVRLHDALRLTRSALAKSGQDATVMDSVGWAHYRLGEYEKAAFYLERALRHAEGEPLPPVAAWVWDTRADQRGLDLATYEYHLGAAYARLGRIAEARRMLAQCLAHDPQYGPVQDELELLRYELQGAHIAGAPATRRRA